MLLDTDVIVDVFRGHPPAVNWFSGLGNTPISLPGLVAMELLQGCRSFADQHKIEKKVQGFTLHWPNVVDCQRAHRDFAAFRLSHGLGLLDALIGHTAVGLQEPLATFNVKHYAVVHGLVTVQPY